MRSLAAIALGACIAVNVYAGPPATTDSVLIDAATLQDWMDNGQFQGAGSCGKVVLLDVTDPARYAAGHIPGAQLWNIGEQVQTRLEGPAPAVNMVLDGAHMDAMLQKHGIDKNTTIIITSSQSETYFPARAYFLLRYWGFPKKQLKVLDGFNGAWDPIALTTEPTVCPPTDYSVKDRGLVLTDERASLDEAIAAVRYGTGMMVDMRGDKSAAGSTPGVFPEVAGDYVVFEGATIGGSHFVWKDFNLDYDGGDLRFKPADEIRAALLASGIDGAMPVLSYCRTGYIGSVGYLVLDGILGWEVMTYDGSWAQWGKLSDKAALGGELPSGSLWALDSSAYMETLNYNAPAGYPIETLELDLAAHDACPSPFDPCANNIEQEDLAYATTKR